MPQEDAHFGSTLLMLDDTDGNGAGEYLIAATGDSVNDLWSAGRVYHIDGVSNDTIQTFTTPNPVSSAFFGHSMARIADVNENGSEDIAISAIGDRAGDNPDQTGAVYIYDGSTLAQIMEIRPPEGQETSNFGGIISRIQDVNADGIPDVVVTDQRTVTNVANTKNVLFIYSGGDSNNDGALDYLHQAEEPVQVGVPYYGIQGDVAAGSDLNGDGAGDILVGSIENNQVFLISGATGNIVDIIITPAAGETYDEDFGTSVSYLNDLNSDGIREFLVTAPTSDGGTAYVYDGANRRVLYELESPLTSTKREFGFSTARIPDVNGDGQSDILISSKSNAPDGTNYAGRVYLYSTSDLMQNDQLISPDPQKPYDMYLDNYGREMTGLADLNGDNRAEILVAAPYDSVQDGIEGGGRVFRFSSEGFPDYNQPPMVSISADTNRATAWVDSISFAAIVSDADGSIISYAWDFDGDGRVDSEAANPTHRYLGFGRYGVTLTVMDDDSVARTATKRITILRRESASATRLTDNTYEDTNPFIIGPSLYYYHSTRDEGVIRDATSNYSRPAARQLNADQKNLVYAARTIDGNSGIYYYNQRITPDELGISHAYPSRGGYPALNDDLGERGLIAYMRAEGASTYNLAAYTGTEHTSLGNQYDVQLPRVSGDGYTIAYAGKKGSDAVGYGIYRYTWSDSVPEGTVKPVSEVDSNETLGSAGIAQPLGISVSDDGSVIAWQRKSLISDYRQIEYWKDGIVYGLTARGWPVVSDSGRYILTHDYLYDTRQQKGLDFGDPDYGDMEASDNYRYTFDMDSDANYIVFTGETDRNLYIHNRSTLNTTRVREADDDMRTPRISPNGQHLIWEEEVNGEDWEIFRTENPVPGGEGVDTIGINISRLPEENKSELVISQHGKYSAFLGLLGSSNEVYLYNRETGTRRQITENTLDESYLRIADNGSALAWQQSNGNTGIPRTAVYDIRKKHTETFPDFSRPELLSADGSKIWLRFSGGAGLSDAVYDLQEHTYLFNPGSPDAASADLQKFLYEENDSLYIYDYEDEYKDLIAVKDFESMEPLMDRAGESVLYHFETENDMERVKVHHTATDSEQVVYEGTTSDNEDLEELLFTDRGNAVYYSLEFYDPDAVYDLHTWYRYDVENGTTTMIDSTRSSISMEDPDYSAGGRFFTYSKVVQEDPVVQDIFYYDHQTGMITQLTGDDLDDQDPVISNDGSTLIWRGEHTTTPDQPSEVWQYQIFEPTDLVSENHNLPGEFKLYANYPNPFNPSTTIQFLLPARAEVRVVVYNIRGQLIKRLTPGVLQAGIRQIRFHGGNLPNGVYLYRVVAKMQNRTRSDIGKFTVLK